VLVPNLFQVKEYELFSPETAYGINVPHVTFQDISNVLDSRITMMVPERIVDFF